MTRITVDLPRAAYDAAEALAVELGTSKTAVMARALGLLREVERQREHGAALAFVDEQDRVTTRVVLL